MMDALSAYLATVRGFDWASANCCHFAAGWLKANGRPDPMKGLRPTATPTAAHRFVKRRGGIERLCTKRLGREPVPAAFAQRGDIVLFDLEGGAFTVGICNGRVSACIAEDGNLAWPDTISGRLAWRLA